MFIEETTKLFNNLSSDLNEDNITFFNEKIYICSSDFLDNYLNIIYNEENFYKIPALIDFLKQIIIQLLNQKNPKVIKTI